MSTCLIDSRFGDTCIKEAIAMLAGQLAVGDVEETQIDKTKAGDWREQWGDMGFLKEDQTEENVEAAVREAVQISNNLPFAVTGRDYSKVSRKILGY